MPDVQHNALSGSELHEPKGISGAAAGAVYIADGAGSGSWSQPVVDADDGAAGEVPVANGSGDVVWSPREYHLTGVIADISTASTVYVAIPYAGNVAKIVTVLGGTIATADSTVTLKDNAGNTMGGVLVAFSGSAAGDVDFDDTIANSDVTSNDFVSVETDGASTNTIPLYFTIVVERSS